MWPIWRVNKMVKAQNKNETFVNYLREDIWMIFENFKLNVLMNEQKRKEEKRRQIVNKIFCTNELKRLKRFLSI